MKIRGRTLRTLEGLLLSLLIHLLIFLLFFLFTKKITPTPPPPASRKISLNLQQISTTPPRPKAQKHTRPIPPSQPPSLPKPVTPLPKVTPPTATPVVKRVARKKVLDEKARLVVEKKTPKENNVTKIVKKQKTKKTSPAPKAAKRKREKSTKKSIKRRVVHKPSRSRHGLAGALMGSGSTVSLAPRSTSSHYGSQMIKQLYGAEFDRFTPTQKRFIKNNLERIHRITQRTLIQNGYPDVAVRTMQEGTNIVTFYLHPNGNITQLRLLRHIGYTTLDENTLQVIRIAYKDYPRPKTKTKITFYVQYRIY